MCGVDGEYAFIMSLFISIFLRRIYIEKPNARVWSIAETLKMIKDGKVCFFFCFANQKNGWRRLILPMLTLNSDFNFGIFSYLRTFNT